MATLCALCALVLTQPASAATASGDWVGTYGASGYALPTAAGQDASSFGGLTLTQGNRWTWAANTTDGRGLQTADGSGRAATNWYGDTLRLSARFAAGFRGKLRVYAVDWDTHARRQTVTVSGGLGSSQVQTLDADFNDGAWLVFDLDVPANQTVTITAQRTAGPNAVLSGIFADPAPSTPAAGDWVGRRGGDGYVLSAFANGNDVGPLAGLVDRTGQSWTWRDQTTDGRALQSPDGSGRTAATWYDRDDLTIALRFKAAYTGRLRLYAVDWDTHARRQTVTVSGGLGSSQVQTLDADFNDGAWLSFPVDVAQGGTLSVVVHRLAGPNAVLSGMFLDDGSAAPTPTPTAPAAPTPTPTAPAPTAPRCVDTAGSATPPFLIGVWEQPSASFARWRSAGINTIVDDLGLNDSAPFAEWSRALACQDLYAVRPPQQDLAAEDADPRLLALAFQDEPDVQGVFPEELQAERERWKAGAPSKPIWATFSGANIYEQPAVVNASRWTYATETTDGRALQTPDGSGRVAATWYDPERLVLSLRFKSSYTGRLRLYAVDWDSHERRQSVTVTAPGAAPQTRQLDTDFHDGAWLTYDLDVPAGATVRIAARRLGGANSVLSGIFLGGGSSPPTGGDWVGRAGSDGYALARGARGEDVVSLPPATLDVGLVPEQLYRDYSSAADWISEDIYPLTGYGRPDWIDLSQRAPTATGDVLDRLATWAPGKPTFAFIEAAKTAAPGLRAPTAEEFRGEIWDAIIHGARGIAYYTQSGSSDDAIPGDVAAEMVRQNALLAQWGSVLVAPGAQQTVPLPFERATRRLNGTTYTLTLNASHQPASLEGSTFAPYEVRISPQTPSPN
ncbi:MAG: hypothetical protein ACR2NB_05730 [Solirubrobacteraceae bacterium]